MAHLLPRKTVEFLRRRVQVDAGQVGHLTEASEEPLQLTQRRRRHVYTRRAGTGAVTHGRLLGTHPLYDVGEIDVFDGVGEAPQAPLLLGDQDGDAGQSNVGVLEVLLDLVAVLRRGKRKQVTRRQRFSTRGEGGFKAELERGCHSLLSR